MPWHKLYPILNSEFKINASSDDWKEVLVPERSKKLIGVCELISINSKIENINSISLFGNDCLKAAVFRRLKENLNVNQNIAFDIKPSSNISEYLNDNLIEIVSEIIILSKGKNIIKKIEFRKGKKGINIFKKVKYIYSIPNMITFKDLISEIVKINKENIISIT